MGKKLQWPLTIGLFVFICIAFYVFIHLSLHTIFILSMIFAGVPVSAFTLIACYFVAKFLIHFKRLKDEA